MTGLSDADFRAVRDYLLATAGLVFDQSRRAGLASVVADRVRAMGAPDVPAYLAMLADGDGEGAVERQRLLDRVTVQETQFFRNAPQMEALRHRVLPELLRRSAGRGRPLTVWSAGCSTGEEPYSVAMMLLDLAPSLAKRPHARVLATDISARALQVARRGSYSGRTLQSAPAEPRERWFEPRPGGALAVAPAVRRLVELRLHNLVTDPPPFGPGEVDLVVCRNVTIYFDRATTRSLMSSFHGVLAEGGYLLLGHSETLWQVSDEFSLVPVGDAFVYRRSHEARRGAVRRRRVAPARRPVGAPRLQPSSAAVPAPTSDADVRRSAVADGATAPALLVAARDALASGEYPAAAGAAEAALEADRLLSPAYVLLGRARSALGEDAAAVDPLRKAVYLDPAAGDAHFLLAGVLARLGQHPAAAASYRAAGATLHRLDPSALDELFGGRDVAELVELCARLADRSAGDVTGVGVVAGGAP